MEKYFEKTIDLLIKFGGKLILAILIILIGFKIVDIIIKRIKKDKGFSKIEKSSQTFLSSIISLILKSLIIITAVAIIGIPMTSIIAVIGSLGLALGLALQGGLSNIAGGVMIMLFKPFKVGDYIETNSNSGYVKEINIFHTILETFDRRIIVLPNGNLSNSIVINYNSLKYNKVELKIAISYNNDIDKVRTILDNISKKSKYYLNDEKYSNTIVVSEHGENAIIFTFRMWVDSNNYWNAKFELLENIKKEFDKNNIKIPYNQLDVHIDKQIL